MAPRRLLNLARPTEAAVGWLPALPAYSAAGRGLSLGRGCWPPGRARLGAGGPGVATRRFSDGGAGGGVGPAGGAKKPPPAVWERGRSFYTGAVLPLRFASR
jgi:hypothetical protein